MSMKYLALFLATVVPAPLSAQTPPPPPPAEAKTSAMPYVMAAGMSDLYEITSSQVALQKSQNPAIKTFATMLIKHHQMTTIATMKAAKKSGLTPTPPVMDAGTTASVSELRTASAADFDRLYIGQQIPAHKAALDLHQGYATGGDQAPLRTTATAAIPVVKQHIAAATKLQSAKKMNGMSGM